MQTLYKPINLETEELIRNLALEILQTKWNFVSEQLFRLPFTGVDYIRAYEELRDKRFGEIGMWTIFARGMGGHQNIHKDDAHSGFIIPVTGTVGSKMQWFNEEGLVFKKIMNRDGKTAFHSLSAGTPEIIQELEVTKSIIANVGVPHRAVAGQTPRAVVSIKMKGNPKLL
jgi:hypothetical protein